MFDLLQIHVYPDLHSPGVKKERMFATPARKWTVLAVGGVAFIVLSMMYFGAFKSGAVVSGA